MIEITFYIQASPVLRKGKPDGLAVKEFYRWDRVRINPSGQAVKEFADGHVDADIIASNGKEYEKFKTTLDANYELLADQARAEPGQPVFFDYQPQPKVVTEDAEAKPKKKGKK